MATRNDQIIFSIIFKKGLAERQRLPLDHVISTLMQIQQMIREVGKQIQRDAGIENPDGDFGVELLAGPAGLAFRKGSLKAAATITHDIPNGLLAINALIDTTDVLGKRNPSFAAHEYAEPILRRLPKLSRIQEEDQTELHLALSKDRHVLNKTTLGEKGRETLKRFEAPELGIDAITVYGKLRELRDQTRTDEEDKGFFWGEIVEESGRVWRVRFRDSAQTRVMALFRKQVAVTGNVAYFKTKTPRVDAVEINSDAMPDYLAAYQRFNEAYQDVFEDIEAEDILDQIRG